MSLDNTLASIAESLASLAETNRQLLDFHRRNAGYVTASEVRDANTFTTQQMPAGSVQYVEQVQFQQPPAQQFQQQPVQQAVIWTPEGMNELAKKTAERLGGPAKIMELFTKYNATGFSTLDPAQFSNFATELQALV